MNHTLTKRAEKIGLRMTVYDIMSKAADLHTCVQNRIFCEKTHGADGRRGIMIM